MSAANHGVIVGNIVSDITDRQINEDLHVTSFRVAPVDAREGDSPVPIVAYNGVGNEIFSRYNKGDLLSLEYRLRYVTWQTEEGEPRGRMEVIATSFTTIRLGQISTAKRAEAATQPSEEKPVKKQLELV